MKAIRTAAVVLSALVPVASAGEAQSVKVTRIGSQASIKGPAETFTGTVRIDSLFQTTSPARVGGGFVSFEPGARTAWHTHPLGQTLIVTAGFGLVQQWNAPIQEIRPGDIAWIPPGVKHWHGAAASTTMTHIAIAEALDGKVVDWMEMVSDEQYGIVPNSAEAAVARHTTPEGKTK